MTVMTKRGTHDNIVTYQHVCDKKSDMANILSEYINLGTTCIVLEDESMGNTLQVYIANSKKKWIVFGNAGTSSGEEADSSETSDIADTGLADSMILQS